MGEAGSLLLLLFLGGCSLIIVRLFWPVARRVKRSTTMKSPVVIDQAHRTTPTVPTLQLCEWLEIVNEKPDDAPHTLIIGTSGTGKTTLAQAIAATRTGYLAILDLKWKPGKWGGLSAIPIDDDGHYTQLEAASHALLDELTSRLVSLKQGITEFPQLTIIVEEFPTLIAECPSAGELFKQVGRLGRELCIRLVGLSQSERVKSLGISGEGDAKDNYTIIRLGKAAIEVLPEARHFSRPAALEWKGEYHMIVVEGIAHLASRSIHHTRSWALAMPEKPLLKQGSKQKFQQNAGEALFSIEEIADIVALILKGTQAEEAVPSLPRYNRRKHRQYTDYYERLAQAMTQKTSTSHLS